MQITIDDKYIAEAKAFSSDGPALSLMLAESIALAMEPIKEALRMDALRLCDMFPKLELCIPIEIPEPPAPRLPEGPPLYVVDDGKGNLRLELGENAGYDPVPQASAAVSRDRQVDLACLYKMANPKSTDSEVSEKLGIDRRRLAENEHYKLAREFSKFRDRCRS